MLAVTLHTHRVAATGHDCNHGLLPCGGEAHEDSLGEAGHQFPNGALTSQQPSRGSPLQGRPLTLRWKALPTLEQHGQGTGEQRKGPSASTADHRPVPSFLQRQRSTLDPTLLLVSVGSPTEHPPNPVDSEERASFTLKTLCIS